MIKQTGERKYSLEKEFWTSFFKKFSFSVLVSFLFLIVVASSPVHILNLFKFFIAKLKLLKSSNLFLSLTYGLKI